MNSGILIRPATVLSSGTILIAVLLMSSCATLSYYSGSSNDKELIRQVLLLHSQSVISGHTPGHELTQLPDAIHAGPFTGMHPGDLGPRAETPEQVEKMAKPEGWVPPERQIVGKVRLTKVSIKFMNDTVAFATFREVGFDGLDRRVYQHDVAAFLTKVGRDWKIFAMAGGNIIFDREGLDQNWYLAPERENRSPRIN